MHLTAPATRDGQISKPPSEPNGRGCGREIHARIDRAVNVTDKFPEFSAVDLPAVSGRIENRHSMVALISNADQERRGQIDSEDIESHTLGNRAVREGARHGQTGDTRQHQVEIHGVWVVGDFLVSPQSQLHEEGLIEVGEQAIHAARIVGVSPAREVRYTTSNLLCERFKSSLGASRINVGTPMRSQRNHRVDDIPVPIEFRQRGAIS